VGQDGPVSRSAVATPAPATAAEGRAARLLVVVGIAALGFNLRPAAVSVGPVLREITAGLGMSSTTAGVLTTLPVVAFAGFGALALCAGAAFLLDDPAAATVNATPRSLASHRLLRVALALPLLGAVWAGSLWYATAADGAWFGPQTRAALSLQFAAMLTLTLAGSAIALRVMPDEHGGWTGALAPFAIVAAILVSPQRWALLAAPGDSMWHAAQERWAALLAVGLLTLTWANRDPASRSGRCKAA